MARLELIGEEPPRRLEDLPLPGREQQGPPMPGVPEQYGPPAELNTPPNVPMDVAKGVGSGFERGVVGAPGIPTDLFRLAQLGWLYTQGKLYGPEHRQRMEAMVAQQPDFLPGSGEIIEAAKPYVPGIGYEPQTPAGEVGQTFGELLPGAVAPGQAALRGAGLGARALRAGVDAVYQAAIPAAAGEAAETAAKDTRFEPYAKPAATVAASAAMGRAPLPRAATAVPGYSPGATERVNRGIMDEGGHAAVGAELERLGPDGRLMDVGPNLTGQAEALVSSPGPAQSEILRAVRERNAGAGDRISAAVDRTIGDPVDFHNETQALLAQRRLRGNQLYGRAEAQGARIDTRPVMQHIESILPPTTAAPTPIEQTLVNVRAQLNGRNDLRSLHNVKEGLDDQITAAVRANEGALANRLRGVRDRLVQQLDEGTTVRDPQGQPMRGPDGQPQSLYRQARQEYAGDSAILRAREEGLSVFDRDLSPSAMARENLARSEAERIAFQEGARESIEMKMGNARNDALAVRNTFEARHNREKLIQVVGQAQADDLINVLRQETRLAGTNQRLTSQSATAGRQAAQKEFPSSLPESKPHWPSVTELPTRILQGAYRNTVGPVIDAFRGERRGEISRDAGRMHTMPEGPERADLLEQLRRAYERGDRRAPQAVTAPMALYGAELDSDQKPLEITVHPWRRR